MAAHSENISGNSCFTGLLLVIGFYKNVWDHDIKPQQKNIN
jgi:hypothetical protein